MSQELTAAHEVSDTCVGVRFTCSKEATNELSHPVKGSFAHNGLLWYLYPIPCEDIGPALIGWLFSYLFYKEQVFTGLLFEQAAVIFPLP